MSDDDDVDDYMSDESGSSDGSLLAGFGTGLRDYQPSIPTNGDESVKRVWSLTFMMSSARNLSRTEFSCFFVVQFGHAVKKKTNGVRRATFITPAIDFKVNEVRVFPKPVLFFERERICVSESELANFYLTIDAWQLNTFGFNTLLGTRKLSLKAALHKPAASELTLYKPLESGKKGQDAFLLRASFDFAEVYDFQVTGDCLAFMPSTAMPSLQQSMPKALDLRVSQGLIDLDGPDSDGIENHHLTPKEIREKKLTRRRLLSNISTTNFWAKTPSFIFRGTKIDFENSFIKVTVCAAKTKSITLPMGSAIVTMGSVLEFPLIRSDVRRVPSSEENFKQGVIQGNFKVRVKRVCDQTEEDILSRPHQPTGGAAQLQHLDPSERYLVVRISKCENLPAADEGTGFSDPFLRIKWDGMLQTSNPIENTVRPAFNQNFYFPMRTTDNRLLEPDYKHLLAQEMLCKGPLTVEVWDSDPASSEYLGGVDIDLADLTTRHVDVLKRCLAHAMDDEVGRTDLQDVKNSKKEKRRKKKAALAGEEDSEDEFQEGDDDDDDEDENEDDDKTKKPVKPEDESFLVQELKTRVFIGEGLELSGSELNGQGGTPQVWLEAFFFPDLASDFHIPRRSLKKQKSIDDDYKHFGAQFSKSMTKFEKAYVEWFPSCVPILGRHFHPVVELRRGNRCIPLSSFIVPTVPPEKLAGDAELMSWVRSFAYLPLMSSPGGKEIEEIGYGVTLPPQQVLWGRTQTPGVFMVSRKGSSVDHAILLCSFLLSLKRDAYVAIGTTENGSKQIAWVVTRERPTNGKEVIPGGSYFPGKVSPGNADVLFWDVTNGNRFYLPSRWGLERLAQLPNLKSVKGSEHADVHANARRNQRNEDEDDDDEDEDDMYDLNAYLDGGETANMPVDIEGDTIMDADNDITIIAHGTAKGSRAAQKRAEREKMKKIVQQGGGKDAILAARFARMKAFIDTNIDRLPICPIFSLCEPNQTLVVTPFTSIDVIFNHESVWSNIQNMNPSCISFDLEDPLRWRKFKVPGQSSPPMIESFVQIPPALRGGVCANIAATLQKEIESMISLARKKQGRDTKFEIASDRLVDVIDHFLDLLEFKATKCDPFFDPGPPPAHSGWTAFLKEDVEEVLMQDREKKVEDFKHELQMKEQNKQKVSAMTKSGIKRKPKASPTLKHGAKKGEDEDEFADAKSNKGDDDDDEASSIPHTGENDERLVEELQNDLIIVEDLIRKPIQPKYVTDANDPNRQEQMKRWRFFYEAENHLFKLTNTKKRFPLRPNCSFIGFPVQLNSADPENVLQALLKNPCMDAILFADGPVIGIKKQQPSVSPQFIVSVNVNALPAACVSVWVFVGCILPWTQKQIQAATEKNKGKKKTK